MQRGARWIPFRRWIPHSWNLYGTAGPAVGFKHYLSDNTAVVTRYRYEWYFDKLSFKDATDTADGNHVVTVGMSYSWK